MEEDIKILEDFIKYFEAEAISRKYRRNISITVGEDDIQAIENLIKGYRELKERNIYLVNERKKLEELLFMSDENYIPKSKIKEKIEELEKEKEETYTKFLASDRANANLSTKGKMIEGGIEVLQELIKEAQWKSLE